jgi:hypothetical protein
MVHFGKSDFAGFPLGRSRSGYALNDPQLAPAVKRLAFLRPNCAKRARTA